MNHTHLKLYILSEKKEKFTFTIYSRSNGMKRQLFSTRFTTTNSYSILSYVFRAIIQQFPENAQHVFFHILYEIRTKDMKCTSCSTFNYPTSLFHMLDRVVVAESGVTTFSVKQHTNLDIALWLEYLSIATYLV